MDLEEYFRQSGMEFKKLHSEKLRDILATIEILNTEQIEAADQVEKMYLTAKIHDFDLEVCEILSAFAKSRFPEGKFYLSRATVSGRRILWSVYYPDQDAFEFKKQKSFYYVSVALVFDEGLEEKGFEIKGVAGAGLRVGPTTGELVAELANAFPINKLNGGIYIS